MTDHALSVAFVVAAWWASTALVLRLVWLGRATHRYSVAIAGVLAVAALVGAWWSSSVPTAVGAYVAFVSALAIWGFHELTFLLGVVTGPRKTPCPPGARGVRRFVHATATVIHHEIALALTAVVLVALTWNADNSISGTTFLVLWVMRLSAKLNLFFGVQNVADELVPERMRYLSSYFRRARMNPLMPVSLLGALGGVAWLFASASSLDATRFVVVGHTLVGTLLALAWLEHLFLAIPLPDALLFRWVVRSDRIAASSPLEAIGPTTRGDTHEDI